MKQGTGRSTDSGRKIEPKSQGINPGYVSQIGVHEINLVPEPMHERGFTAPQPVATTIHHGGSQGKHK